MGTYEQSHWQLSYVLIFHIAINGRVIPDVENGHLRTTALAIVRCPVFQIGIDRRVIRNVANCFYEHLHWLLSYVPIFHIAIDRRVIRDVENWHL